MKITEAAGVDRAAEYLASRGLRVLDKNWQRQLFDGVLPIVAADRRTLVVAVVFGRQVRHPFLTRARVQRLRELSVSWMQAHGARFYEVRVDVVMITVQGVGGWTIEHVKNVGAGI